MSDIISCQEVKTRLDRGGDFIFWDVREAWEHEEENIGASCMPLNDLPVKIQELMQYKDREIIVHCKTGDRSMKAKKFLSSRGFTNVKSMQGGIQAFLSD